MQGIKTKKLAFFLGYFGNIDINKYSVSAKNDPNTAKNDRKKPTFNWSLQWRKIPLWQQLTARDVNKSLNGSAGKFKWLNITFKWPQQTSRIDFSKKSFRFLTFFDGIVFFFFVKQGFLLLSDSNIFCCPVLTVVF
jgi:hypothetical protein